MPSPIASNRLPSLASNPTTLNNGAAQPRERSSLDLAQLGTVLISKEAKARHEASQKAAAAAKAYQQELTEARQNRARERLEEIKRRIEQLKSLVMMLGAGSAKGMLRELKQLAGELKQVAGTLKEGTSSATPAQLNEAPNLAAAQAGPSEAANAQADDAEGRAAYAATQTLSEAGQPSASAGAQGSKPATLSSDASRQETQAGSEIKTADEKTIEQQKDRQREDDAQSIQTAVRALKELLALLKSQLAQQQRNDKETRKQIDEITHLISDSEKAADGMYALSAEGVGAVAGLSINVDGNA